MIFYSFLVTYFTVIWQAPLLLLFVINLSFSLAPSIQIIFYFTWFSYPSRLHIWFATTRRNRLILVSSPCYGCLILVTLFLRYHCDSPFCGHLLLLPVTIFFSLSFHILVIFFSLSLCLVDITLSILVTTVSSPCWYRFAYPCHNLLILVWVVLSMAQFLCLSLSLLSA